MPYVTCPRCAVRSYVVPRQTAEPCPVCGSPLPVVGASVSGPTRADGDASPSARDHGSDPEARDAHRAGSLAT